MPQVKLHKQVEVSRSPRARQVEALFDLPTEQKAQVSWEGKVPIEAQPWNVGLIVGPSGCGKTSVALDMFGKAFHPELRWQGKSVIDDFPKDVGVQQIAAACSSVGFNTMPAWLRPHAVLSNGEKFRVDLARRLLELPDPVVVDEFTSVVDRQVAQIGSHAIGKWVRKLNRQFVAVSCHYDIEQWLQPDWVLEPATMSFRWRSLRRRPGIDVSIAAVKHDTWQLFAPYHYMNAQLNRSAQCFALFVDDRPAAFAGVLHFPHPRSRNLKSLSRMVTLPDWQGLGLAFILMERLGAAYKAMGYRFMTHPAHPPFIRSFDRSPVWKMKRAPGKQTSITATSNIQGMHQSRPCATFEYAGPPCDRGDASNLITRRTKVSAH